MKSGLEGRNNAHQPLWSSSRPACLNEVRPRRPEQYGEFNRIASTTWGAVSMKSGLEGRNNQGHSMTPEYARAVSMKSGLEGRNNGRHDSPDGRAACVSMKSGLEGRNNQTHRGDCALGGYRLNEVRPRRPEQSGG